MKRHIPVRVRSIAIVVLALGSVHPWVATGAKEDPERLTCPFGVPAWDSGRRLIPIPIGRLEDVCPARIELDRILLDSPVGQDTLDIGGQGSLALTTHREPVDQHEGEAKTGASVASALDPLWTPPDGDVLVISSDALAPSLNPFLSDLSARGYRCARSCLSLILRDYGEGDPSTSIQEAVADACQNFATRPLALILVGTASEDDPTKDGLPTIHTSYEHEFPGTYDTTFAEDPAFGNLIVGRIPVRSGAELNSYLSKLQAYRAQPHRPSVHFAVGDASINRVNADRRRAVQELLAELADEGVLQGTAQFASAYTPLYLQVNRQRALNDLLQSLTAGAGLLALFGNNTRPTNIVHALEAPPGPDQPWLLPAEMPTAGRLPIALFGTCLNGAFDEDAPFSSYDSPAETWVREGRNGAIAVLAPSHLTTFFDDWEITSQFLRRLTRGDGALLGAIHAGTRQSLLREWTRGARSAASVRMVNLLGDPLLAPRIGVNQDRLDGSFDPGGAWPLQNQLESGRGWTTNDLIGGTAEARVIERDGTLHPLDGSFMVRCAAEFGEGTARRAVAWKLISCDLLVRSGHVLRYWVRHEIGHGRLGVDALTQSGRVLSRDLRDTRGLQADPDRYRYPPHAWHCVTIRLDPWTNERIRTLYLRYEASHDGSATERCVRGERPQTLRQDPLPPESLLGFVDGLAIEPEDARSLLDCAFARDADANGRPDSWTAPWPASLEGRPAGATIIHEDGPPYLLISSDSELPAGLSQVVNASPGQDQLSLGFETKSDNGGILRIALVDPSTGESLDARSIGPIGTPWSLRCVTLDLPAGRPSLLELRMVTGTARIANLCEESEAFGFGHDADLPSVPRLRIEPNPTAGPICIRWESEGAELRRVAIFDVAGRRIAFLHPGQIDGSRGLSVSDLRTIDGHPLGNGVYFIRIDTAGGSVTRRLHVVR